MIASLLLLVASALDLGTSPLVDADHSHRWIEFQNDAEGTGWLDHAWRSETVANGQKVELVLMRAVINEEAMTVDIVMAVDCERDQMGINDGWLHSSNFGDSMRLPIEEVVMDFADNPPNEVDRKVIDFACAAEAA